MIGARLQNRTKDMNQEYTPGPQSYFIKESLNSKSAIMSKEARFRNLSVGAENLGPGFYEQGDDLTGKMVGGKFSDNGRFSGWGAAVTGADSPGPGFY